MNPSRLLAAFVLSITFLFPAAGLTPGGGDPAALPASPPAQPTGPDGPQAAVTHLTDLHYLGYQPFLTTSLHVTETLTGTLPYTLTWALHNLDAQALTNLSFSSVPSGRCTQMPNNDIACTGSLTRFDVGYNYYYTPTVYDRNSLDLGWDGTTTFLTDYTIQLTYPSPLVYISTPFTPTSHVGNQITWFQPNTDTLAVGAVFSDPRIKVLNLPLVRR